MKAIKQEYIEVDVKDKPTVKEELFINQEPIKQEYIEVDIKLESIDPTQQGDLKKHIQSVHEGVKHQCTGVYFSTILKFFLKDQKGS